MFGYHVNFGYLIFTISFYLELLTARSEISGPLKTLILPEANRTCYLICTCLSQEKKNHSSCNDFTALMRFVSDGKLIEMQYLPDGLSLSHEIPEQNCINTFSN